MRQTPGHYMRELAFVQDVHKGQYVQDEMYGQGRFSIENGGEIINAWDSYWAKLKENALSIKNNKSFQSVLSDQSFCCLLIISYQ